MSELASEQGVINSNIVKINQLVGKENTGYTANIKLAEPDETGAFVVLCDGSDGKKYHIQMNIKEPHVRGARVLIVLD